ncbi:MAG: tyrosine-type recombinase/integrase [Luminiphilus sp.]
MGALTVKEYADSSRDRSIRVETGVNFRIRHHRNGVIQREWRYRFTINGRRHEITRAASGRFKEHLATDLRVIAEWKDQVRQGINPRREMEVVKRRNEAGRITFREVALEFLPSYQSQLTNLKQQKAILSELERYAFPVLGDIQIANLRLRDVADALRPLWHEHYAVARKVRDRISKTCTYAVSMDYLTANPVDQKALEIVLGKSRHAAKSFKAPRECDLPVIFQNLIQSGDVYDLATAFMIATWSRSAPLRNMVAGEVAEDVWNCPKTKNGNPYRIPLSPAALLVLERAGYEHLAPDALVFPGKRARVLPENALRLCIKKYSPNSEDTAHGVRATLSTYLNDHHDFGEEMVEACMQHEVKTLTQAAYNRGDWL